MPCCPPCSNRLVNYLTDPTGEVKQPIWQSGGLVPTKAPKSCERALAHRGKQKVIVDLAVAPGLAGKPWRIVIQVKFWNRQNLAFCSWRRSWIAVAEIAVKNAQPF